MASNEDFHDELHKVLSKFKLEDLKNHAMRDFPEGSWSGVCEIVRDAREDLKPKTVASAIVKMTKKHRLEGHEIYNRLNVLKLREYGLSSTKIWFAYELTEKLPDYEEVPFRNIASRIEHSVRASVIAIRATHDCSSILLSVKRNRQLITVCITSKYLLICPRTNNHQLIENIAKGVGYRSVKNCYLSGRHIPSLLRILEQKDGATHFNAVISQPTYRPMPRRTRLGLDFTTSEPVRNYLKELRGNEENAPCLQQLTLHTKAPFKKGNFIYSTAVLNSSNVDSSLRDMTAANIIPPSSLFFSMVYEHCKNEMKVKIT